VNAPSDPLTFDELVDVLRVRLGDAGAINPSELHSFKTLMADNADVIPDHWYHEVFDELQAQGHLDPASRKTAAFEAWARLSADGRLYLRSQGEDS
jgi:hypothetical protein